MIPTVCIEPLDIELEGEHGDGFPSDLELKILCRLVHHRRPSTIFEFGTFRGRTTLHLARCAPSSVIYTLDLPPGAKGLLPYGRDDKYVEQRKGEFFVGSPEGERIRWLRGDSATFDFRPFLGRMEFVWVDGCHGFESVLNDSLRALMLIRPGGMIAWHDTLPNWPGVHEAIECLGRYSQAFNGLRRIEGTTLAVCEP